MSSNPLDDILFDIETPLSAPTRVQSFELVEALNEPYAAQVTIVVEDGAAAREDLLGQDAVVTLTRGDRTRRFCGLIHMVRQSPSAQDHSTFRLEIVPALAMLRLRRNTRMFQEKTVPEILETVLTEALDPYGRSYTLELDAEYPTREYCLQYQETDLDFVHRLMEEEGIAYTFTHEGDVEELQLRDANTAHPQADVASPPVPFDQHNLVIVDREPVVRFERGHRPATTAVALRDADWTRGGYVVEDSVGGTDAAGKTRESYEHGWGRTLTISAYDAGARRYQEDDAARQKDVRQEAHRAREIVGYGTGRLIGFAAGTTFELSGHPALGHDGEYLLVRVRHRKEPVHVGTDDQIGTYHCEFECIPLTTTYRPARRTAKPSIPSIQTAVVTGPSGEEIHTDEHGRIKVKFHWDRVNPDDETSSCWIRVQQKWAGSGWGFWWLPRIGMEVVVQFIDGDPDRPLVTGSVYNGTNALPYTLPDDKTKSTIKSNSSPGGSGFNEFRFEDKAGSEEIYTHAQKDYNEVVLNDHTTQVGHDQDNHVANNQKQTIHANQTENVDGNQTMTVGGNRTVHVYGDYTEDIDGTETRQVAGDVTETFAASETRTVSSSLKEDISASETRVIGGSQSETIGGSKTQTIGAPSTVTIGGSLTEVAVGGVNLLTAAQWVVDAAGGLNIIAPAGIKLTAPGGWRVAAPGGVMQIDAGREWTGFFWRAKGAFSRGIFGFKYESFISTLTMTGCKTGICGLLIPQLGVKFEFGANEDGKMGAKLTAAGADVHAWGAEAEN